MRQTFTSPNSCLSHSCHGAQLSPYSKQSNSFFLFPLKSWHEANSAFSSISGLLAFCLKLPHLLPCGCLLQNNMISPFSSPFSSRQLLRFITCLLWDFSFKTLLNLSLSFYLIRFNKTLINETKNPKRVLQVLALQINFGF